MAIEKYKDNQNELFEGVRIIFRNFEGKEGPMNRAGDRNFCVLMENREQVERMERNGWNVKYLKPREEGDEPQPYLPVAVGYKGRPPRVVMVTSKGRTTLAEEDVEILDWVDIIHVDLIVRPYDWNVSGNSGRKAYAQSLFIVIQEDYLELKYADVPEIGGRQNRDELPSRSGEMDDVIDAESWEMDEEPLALEGSG